MAISVFQNPCSLMKRILLIFLIIVGVAKQSFGQCPPGAAVFFNPSDPTCPSGCAVLFKGWPEGVRVYLWGGSPLKVVTSFKLPGTLGGPKIVNDYECLPSCNTPLYVASIIPGVSFGCVITQFGTVPVRLTGLSLSLVNQNTCNIKWTTYDEDPKTIFTIQKSLNSIDYLDLATITGMGNAINNYSFLDKSLQNGKFYYRIKVTEFSGKVFYSEIVTLVNSKNLNINIYPNPVEQNFEIILPSLYLPAKISLYNSSGVNVYSNISVQSTFFINKKFPKGIYALRVTGRNNEQLSQTILIK